MESILVIGSSGQIGTELVMNLRSMYGDQNVVASDIKPASQEVMESGPFETLNVMDGPGLRAIVEKYKITQVYHLVAMLSATAEKFPDKGWDLNMTSLFNVLALAKEGLLKKVYWPSSIAAFGPTTPRIETPQFTVMEPTTVYGISKQAGERWCEYYHAKYNVDVRSLRYPGLISWKSEPGGGTTDYAVDVFYEGLKTGKYECFLNQDQALPMMYMPDAIRATIEIMEAPAEQIAIRSSYNLGGISFTPEEIFAEVKKHIPNLEITYAPDFRQAIAETWPASIDDSRAQTDWNWAHKYDLSAMTEDMIKNLKVKLGV